MAGKSFLKPQEQIVVTMEYQKALRNFEEYPNDIARGLNIQHTPVFFKFSKDGEEESLGEVMAPAILLGTPEPDFSMPFNVNAITNMLFGLVLVKTMNILYKSASDYTDKKSG